MLVGMSALRVMLISSVVILSVQAFPSTTRNLENYSKSELEMRKDSEAKSPIVEFVFQDSEKNLSFQKGTDWEKYIISNIITDNETGKLNISDANAADKIDSIKKTELHKSNITDMSKSEDLISETSSGTHYIKGDHWLFNPQEKSSIIGGLPKYFYDAAKPIHPFPEISEPIKIADTNSKKENHENFPIPIIMEKNNQPPQTGGPILYPQSILSRDFDLPFYN
ncbi:GOLD domain-containing protein [Caerostris extrusa]|uniref:GOLD domain-containing protein n=1 Tax=Caerostris extrusa TaxID=172846 RepID=A0AAV4UJQ3_CAEEX|nr:GOLD domain-containing protein [Caerostris extrusa]